MRALKDKEMNVLYLHGLESKPTGPKMKYLGIVLTIIMLLRLIMKTQMHLKRLLIYVLLKNLI